MPAASITLNVDSNSPALSEQQFTNAFGYAAIGMSLASLDGRLIKVNRALCQLLGYAEPELLVRTLQDLTHPDDRDDHENVRRLLAGEIESLQVEKRYLHRDGHAVWTLLSMSLVRDVPDQPLHQFSQVQDITGRKAHELEIARLTRLYAALSQVNQAIVRLPSRDDLFRKVCETLVESGGFRLAWIGWDDSQARRLIPLTAFGDGREYLSVDKLGSNGRFLEDHPAEVAFHTGRPCICDDIRNELTALPWRDQAEQFGLRACAAFPISVAGVVRGTLSVYACEPGILRDKEIALMSEAAVDVSFALDNIARDEERRLAEERRATSEAGLAAAQALAHLGSWELDLATMRGTYSAEMFNLFYRDPALGAPAFAEFSELVHPEDRPLIEQAMAQTAQATAPYTLEYRTNPSLGPVKNLAATINVVRDSAGRPVRTFGTTLDVTDSKRALDTAERMLRRLTEAQRIGQIGDWEWDIATQTITWSAQVFEIFGRDPRQGAPENFEESAAMFDLESRNLLAEKVALAIESGHPQSYELVALRPDGDQVHVHAMAIPVKDNHGRVVTLYGTVQDISARKRAEGVAARMKAIVESSDDAIISKSLQGIIESWNPGAERIFGYSADEIVGRPMLRLIPPQRHGEEEHILSVIRRGERVQHFETVRLRKDGALVDVSVTTSPIRNAAGEIIGASKIARDITDSKRAAEQLRQSEENLAITLQSIGDAVIATDTDGRVTRMNPTAERLTGWVQHEALGQPLSEVFHIVNSQTRALATNPVQLVMAHGEVVGLANHTALLARDGHEYQIFDSAAPIRGRSGDVTGVVLVFSDATEAYRVSAALASTSAMLERTGELAKVGGWELDLATMQPFWSLETCRIHEVDPPAAPALEEILNFYPPDSRAAMQLALQFCIDRGEPFDVELRMVTAKGRAIWVRSQGVAVIEGGKAKKLLGAFHDITERKQVQVALQTSLEEKDAMLREVHHRVKNNLQVINSLLRLEAGRSVQPDTRAVLRDIQGRIHAMALLHESLYRTGTFASVDLSAYLKQLATQAFRTNLSSSGGAVRLELALDPLHVSMDQANPCGLLLNELISNCFKHAFPPGQDGDLRVELQVQSGTEQAILRVSDTGVGLPADFEERRTHSLGLQLVSDFARQLGGSLDIGPGSVFTVTFPLETKPHLADSA